MIPINGMFEASEWSIIVKAVISFLAGALIGLEREKARTSSGVERELAPPGVRSFGFISLISALSVIFPKYLSHVTFTSGEEYYSVLLHFIPVSLAILPVLIICFYTIFKLLILRESGITTPLALVITYAIGISIGLGLVVEGVAISVFTTFMLAVKFRIERIVKVMTYEELLSALQIGIIVFLLGPLFMRDIYDPILGVINFKVLYVFFVIILVLSYMGYIFVRAFGARALHFFSFFGGLVHSEATVVSVVRLGNRLNFPSSEIVGGVVLTAVAMTLRNLILVLTLIALNYRFIGGLESTTLVIIGFIPSILIGYFLTKLYFTRVTDWSIPTESIGKPISYALAAKALLVFSAILIVTMFITYYLGSVGTLASSVLGGIISAEAVIFTVFTLLSVGRIGVETAIASCLIATSVAILNKLLFAKSAGASVEVIKGSLLSLIILSIPPLIVSIAALYV